ncbi:hypothetical protein D8682_00885 (plasmid) [Buttiauxella sp. 3AFRM03]|nr:hypothetical protein D8682_00885 [Buttiauxella sp. 3AFRM03]
MMTPCLYGNGREIPAFRMTNYDSVLKGLDKRQKKRLCREWQVMPVMIHFPTKKESASLLYSFPHKLFDAVFLTKMVIAYNDLMLMYAYISINRG